MGEPSQGAPRSPQASVVVATRNRWAYLEACLASLADQRSDRPFEVVVVDNGSTDATPERLLEWCRADQRFRAVREEQVGLSAAKNAGAASARGRLLIFTDDDVVVEPGWVAGHLAASDGGSVRRLVGGVIVPVASDLGPWPSWFAETVWADLGMLDFGVEGPVPAPRYVWGANMSIPRDVFDECGPWDETVGRRGDERGTFEDTEYQDRARRAGIEVWFTPNARLRHRVDRSTVTPRMAISTAFARAGDAIRLDLGREPSRRFETGPVLAVAAATRVVLLLVWEVVLAVVPAREVLQRAHTAAARAGAAVERLDPVAPGTRLAVTWRAGVGRRLRRVAWRSRRLVSDDPARPGRVRLGRPRR